MKVAAKAANSYTLSMLLKERLEKTLNKELRPVLGEEEIKLFFVSEANFGDFYSPFLMRREISQEEKEKLAQKIISSVEKNKALSKYFTKVEFKEPAFLNFFLSKEILFQELEDLVLEKNIFGEKRKKIILEFISANPTGPLTLGNARGGFLGEALKKLLRRTGHRVSSEFYINNAKNSKQIQELGKTVLGRGKSYLTPYLEALIRKVGKAFKDEAEAGQKIASLIQKDNQNFIEKKLGIEFDNWFSEEDLYREGEIKEVFEGLKKKKLTYEKDGAWFMKTGEFGDSEDRVIVRSDGTPTYFLADITYHLDKFRRGFDKAINIWGADHQGHIKRMKAALKALDVLPKKEFEVILVQMVSLKEKGEKRIMSKRKGEYLALEELVDLVGLDVARFFFLSKSPRTHLEFDLDLALEKSRKNPVYYLQYGWVRVNSLFKKAGRPGKGFRKLKFLEKEEEINLLRELAKFNQFLEDISRDYSVYKLAHYLLNLTQLFFRFYENCPVISAGKDLKEGRLILAEGYRKVMKEGLGILGVSLPKKM